MPLHKQIQQLRNLRKPAGRPIIAFLITLRTIFWVNNICFWLTANYQKSNRNQTKNFYY